MNKDQIHNEASALVYMTDCTLATVCQMAGKKSRPKYEYQRQIAIAQSGINWIEGMSLGYFSRPKDVILEFGGNVSKWAAQYEVAK